MILPTPIPFSPSTAQYYYEWAKRVHDTLSRERMCVRLSEVGLAIEAKSLNSGQWMPIMLKSGGNQFASAEDRQLIYEMVTGAREIPEIIPTEVAP